MYAMITRRRSSSGRQQETLQRAQSEYFPRLQQAPGFVAFYLVAGDDGANNAITLWEDRASAEAFQATQQAWNSTLEEMGSQRESLTTGEVIHQVSRQ
jgi:heme-degrading monooxygenase HmoA